MNHLTTEQLPYNQEMIDSYQTLKNLPGFVLLESTDQTRGRFDIVSALPYDRLRVMRGESDCAAIYHTLQQRLLKTSTPHDFPFQGGAIGYFSYDFAAILGGIDGPKPHPVLLDVPLVDLSFYDWAIVTDHQKREVYLLGAHLHPDTKEILLDIKKRWHNHQSNGFFTLQCDFKSLMTTDEYHYAFDAIHRDLCQGRAYQVNLTQSFVAQYSGDTWESYKLIRRKNPVPYAAYWRGLNADILSFSPERFLLMDKGHVLTSPIKGSMRRSDQINLDASLRAELMSSEKNRAENVMIVDLLRNDLGQFAIPGSVVVTDLCEVQSFNGVHHLVSNVEAIVDDSVTPMQVFSACFPGGSITGAPKRESMRMIAEYESVARGVYCGSIGYFSSHGRFDSNIAIRTITATQDHLVLAAGGGIVIDSRWDEEYRESFTKINAIVSLIKKN